MGTKRLETERLILRRFELEDAEVMYSAWANDDDVTKYLTWDSHEDLEESKKVIGEWIENYDKPDFYEWVIVLKETQKPIGSIGTIYVNDENAFDIGYCLGKSYWGRGYMPEALEEVVRFFIEEVGVEKVIAKHHLDNSKSGRVMKKVGMAFDGEALCHGDSLSYYRAKIYAMTKDRWNSIKSGELNLERENRY